MLKNRVYSSVSTLSLCLHGDNNDSLIQDIETLISITNDNDIANQRIKKVQKKAERKIAMNEIKLNNEQMKLIEEIYEKNKGSYKDIRELLNIIFTDEKSTSYFLTNQIEKLEKELDVIWKEMYLN